MTRFATQFFQQPHPNPTPPPPPQANAKQWESLEPAVKLWTERDNEGPREGETAPSKQHSQGDGGSASSEREADITAGEAGSKEQEEGQHEERAGAPGVSDTTSRIYEEAASLLAHNKAVLGQALARAGRTNEGIVELEAACPEILQYQQNAQGRRDSKKSERRSFGIRTSFSVIFVFSFFFRCVIWSSYQ